MTSPKFAVSEDTIIREAFFNWYEITYHKDADLSNGQTWLMYTAWKAAWQYDKSKCERLLEF